MGLKSIVKELEKVFDTKKVKHEKKIAAIEFLVNELIEKEAKFKAKLEVETDEREIARLERKSTVCNAQIAKGRAAIKDLRDPSKDSS